MITVLVALAGGAGAVTRFVVDGVVARHNRLSLPLGTLVINVTGSFLLGILTGLVLAHPGLSELKMVLGTGFAGGYTTFSTASVEAARLVMRDGVLESRAAVVHALGMLVAGLAAAFLGMLVV